MTHEQVYSYFCGLFPDYCKKAIRWYQNGKNSVRVVFENQDQIIFSYDKFNDWRLETVKSFIKRIT